MRALLVIDVLRDFIYEDGALPVEGAAKLIPRINEEIKKFRCRGEPVIFIADSHAEDDKEFEIWPKHCVKGSEGGEVVEELDKDNRDEIVEKTTYSAFYNTRLEEVLKEKGITEVVLTGVLTDICVMHTAADAAMHGYNVRVLKDCVASSSREPHEWALKHMKSILNASIE
ncbi:MAG: isochorismatase family cysteine hydrolase [Candidatus Hydrothermarchaeota archaeon]|jgi:nicotinamidase-related amidase|nr:isochorismatase family cysteine hydrolase [Candidatus Hydrothermarchaeota archaeon]